MLRWLLFIMAAGGCYAAHPIEDAGCTPAGECPSPYSCSQGKCVAHVVESTPDAFACTPIATSRGVISAPVLTPTIDGDLADWTACFIPLDTTTGIVRDTGAMGMFPSGRFSIAHDATHIYVAAEVMGVVPLGDHALPDIYKNNSISVYVDGDGSFTSKSYDSDAVQLLIDHANQVQGFSNTATITPPGTTTAARTDQATFTIELAVEPATFGLTSFGGSIGFDIGFEGGDGTTRPRRSTGSRPAVRPRAVARPPEMVRSATRASLV